MSGLVGWWPLHDDSAQDLSGNDNHGTINGGVQTHVAGRGGLEAMAFNGSDGYVGGLGELLSTTSDTQPYTISAWIRPDTVSNFQIFSQFQTSNAPPERFIFRITDDGSDVLEWFKSGDGRTQGTTAFTSDTWYHVVGVKNSDQDVRLYVNGSLEADSTDADTYAFASHNSEIGSSTSGSNYADGSVYDVRLYNRALSASEIQTLYEWGSADLARPPTDGVARYALDGDVTDSWGSNDGTNNGVTFVNDAIRGQAGDFQRSNSDYIDTNITPDQTTSSSWSCWVKADSINQSDWQAILSCDDGGYDWSIAEAGGEIQILDGSGIVAAKPINANAWYHFCGVWNTSTSTTKLFINGAEAYSGGLSTDTSNSTLYIGGSPSSSTKYLDGKVDDVRIYDRALSPSEVFELYQWGTGGRDCRHFTVNQ